MTDPVFRKILEKGERAGQIPAKTEFAREWYRAEAKKVKRLNENALMTNTPERLVNKILPGHMYMYLYDPKHKKTLPYYDTFPLVFPYKVFSDRFMGLNLHYLPPVLRANLMDGLYSFSNNRRYDETTRIVMTYKLLNASAKLKWFRPCIKQYLFSHVKSRFFSVQPVEWDIALFLPTARFHKASIQKVYQDSRNMINN